MMPIRRGHGGRLIEASRRFGGEPGDWLDLSTGINLAPWTAGSVAVRDWQRLPEPEDLAVLEANAARYFGTLPEYCCAVPGSEFALRLVARLLALPGRALRPAYGTHIAAFPGEPVRFGETVGTPAAIIFANPANPDGRLRHPADILEWSDRIDEAGGWLAVDEAYADCHPQASVAATVGDEHPLVVFRSFGKFFGLAGLRLGFVLGPKALLAAIRNALGDWPLHGVALALGTSAYRDETWIAAARTALMTRAAGLDAVLARHGLEPQGECPLFRLVQTPRAAELFERLARARILVRAFGDEPCWLRFGVPAAAEELVRLELALSHA